MADLETRLRALGAQAQWPTTPDVAPAIRGRLAAAPPRRDRRRALALAIALALLVPAAAFAAVPSTRHAVLDWLGLRSVRVRTVPRPPRAAARPVDPALGRRATPAPRAAAPRSAPGGPGARPAGDARPRATAPALPRPCPRRARSARPRLPRQHPAGRPHHARLQEPPGSPTRARHRVPRLADAHLPGEGHRAGDHRAAGARGPRAWRMVQRPPARLRLRGRARRHSPRGDAAGRQRARLGTRRRRAAPRGPAGQGPGAAVRSLVHVVPVKRLPPDGRGARADRAHRRPRRWRRSAARRAGAGRPRRRDRRAPSGGPAAAWGRVTRPTGCPTPRAAS